MKFTDTKKKAHTMTHPEITQAVQKFIPHEDIHDLIIEINKHNNQITELTIICKDGISPQFIVIGQIIEAIDELITKDEYGDLVELTMDYTTYYQEDEDNDSDLLIQYTISFGIDS